MTRLGFVLGVLPGAEAEYEQRHNPIWDDLAATLRAHGAHNYTIYLHPQTRQLFATVEIDDVARWNAIGATEVCQRWWAHMRPLMLHAVDGSLHIEPLREVFHLA